MSGRLSIRDAARRLSDKRTLMDDGFWVSKREMRYLDEALAVTDGLDVRAAVNTLRRGGLGEHQARQLTAVMLAAALTGERHDLDDEYLTPRQRARLAALSTAAQTAETGATPND